MASILKRAYTVKLANGKTVRRKCRTYTIEYTGPNGERRREKGYTDRGATEQLAAKLEKAIARGAEGLIDPYREHKARSLAEHVKEYVADLRAMGRDSKYAENMANRLAILRDECGWSTLGEVEPNSFIRWREQRRKESHRGTRKDLNGTSAATLGQYLDSARGFLNWCASNERIEGVAAHGGSRKVSSVLAGISKVEGAKVRLRRALSDEQVAKLLAVAPAERALVYRVGLSIGLRRQEIADLEWHDLQLNAIPAFVQLRAEMTKARRGDRVYFATTLADELRKQRPEDGASNGKVFPNPPSLVLWKKDLKAAGIPWSDENGRRADFHSTRKTLCSRMHKAGVPLAIAMRTMRHVDVKLTMVDYADDAQLGMGNVMAEVLAEPKVPEASAQAS